MSEKNNGNGKEEMHEHGECCEGCGCEPESGMEDLDQHNVDEDTKVHLVLEDDTQLECAVLGIFDVGESEYIALLPVDDEEAEAGVLIYKYVELDEEEFDLKSIEDDDEFQRVSEAFYEIFHQSDIEGEQPLEYGTYDDLEKEGE